MVAAGLEDLMKREIRKPPFPQDIFNFEFSILLGYADWQERHKKNWESNQMEGLTIYTTFICVVF